MIPKVIYKCCKDKKDVDDRILEDMETIKLNNPGHQLILYDNDECSSIIEDYNKDLFKTYLKINPKYGAARADFFRYVCLYKNGGIYLDLKSSLSKPLDTVIRKSDRFLLSHWNNLFPGTPYYNWGRAYPEINKVLLMGEFLQWVIVSEPEHIFLEKIIELVVSSIDKYSIAKDGVGKMATCRTTGPLPYTLAIVPFLKETKYYRLTSLMVTEGFKYTIFDHNKDHEKVFKEHYSRQTEPLILAQDKKHETS